jgi:hypothetical protein
VDVEAFFDETAIARQMNTVDALSVMLTAAGGVVDVRVLKRHRCRSSIMYCEGGSSYAVTGPS